MSRNEALQRMCRGYLGKMRYVAGKHGLGSWLSSLIAANRRGECEGTQKEVEMLSRMVDDERVARIDIPKILGKSYFRCCEDGDFDRIKTLRNVGIYSKVAAMLEKSRKSRD